MADLPRRSVRNRVSNRDSDFIYDSEDSNSNRGENSQHNHVRLNNNSQLSIDNNDECFSRETPLIWSDIYRLLPPEDELKSIQDYLEQNPQEDRSRIQSRIEHLNDRLAEDAAASADAADQNVNNRCEWTSYRRNSSTKFDFIGKFTDNYILSASPNSCISSDNMFSGITNADVEDLEGETSEQCATEMPPKPNSLGMAFEASAVLASVEALRLQVSNLTKTVSFQNSEIRKLKEASNSEDSSNEKRKHRGKVVKDSKQSERINSIQRETVVEEKSKQYDLVKQKIAERDRCRQSGSSAEPNETSDGEGLNLKAMRKKMPKKQRDRCDAKVSWRVKQTGHNFPVDDFEPDSNSGRDSDSDRGACRYRRKIKSGAKIIKRPVIQSELWPHTICNEDNPEEVKSDEISLAKFYSYYTKIMLECRDNFESIGRIALLHAVSLVLECTMWSDARDFHNVTLRKLEQGQYAWDSDFVALAEKFIDDKLRHSYRGKSNARAGSGKGNFNQKFQNYSGARSYNKGFYSNNSYYPQNNSYNKKFSGKSKSLYSSVCKNWNFGNCSIGDRCNLWHICWTCAEQGKVGESHKASSHSSSGSTRPSASDQGR